MTNKIYQGKYLNLYSGIGGNRTLWGDIDVVAVEKNPSIARIYQDFFPNDKIIIGDAHSYLLEHFMEFDFIWSSPPCPTHSRMKFLHSVKGIKPEYPDMKLYEEIIFLKTFYKGDFVVENVKSYYTPLLTPQISGGHYFWSNFRIGDFENRKKVRNDKGCTLSVKMGSKGIVIKDFHGYDGDKRTLLNNAIEPEFGLYILKCARGGNDITQPLLMATG
jgi:DNA (cytosine-5)-methyltransferase 1